MRDLIIRDDVKDEDIVHVIERHRAIYEREYHFDRTFGDYVEESLTEKIERLWIAEQNGKFAGCIGLVEASADTAQLRWFLVEPEARGMGVGKALMQSFLKYCDEKKYNRVFLWTVNKLPAARAIYERFGFQLADKRPEKLLWGQNLVEERWDLSLKTNR